MKPNPLFASIVLLISIIAGTVGALEYFAKDKDLQLVEYRLEQKIQGDNVMRVQERIWQLEDRYEDKNCAEWEEADKEEYRQLKLQLDEMKLQIQQLQKIQQF